MEYHFLVFDSLLNKVGYKYVVIMHQVLKSNSANSESILLAYRQTQEERSQNHLFNEEYLKQEQRILTQKILNY